LGKRAGAAPTTRDEEEAREKKNTSSGRKSERGEGGVDNKEAEKQAIVVLKGGCKRTS